MQDNNPGPTALAARIEAPRLEPGLYLVSTPIGTARDITLRALDVLNAADMLVAEDTRTLRHLMQIHGIGLRGRRVLSHHDHSDDTTARLVLDAVGQGRSVAFCAEAGTPLVADPGYRLSRALIEAGLPLHAVPGPSALLAALAVSGLPSDRFLFAGFVPSAAAARRRWLQEIAATEATAVFFESPRRVKQTLGELCEIDKDRHVVMARELTKRFEEIRRGTARQILDAIGDADVKGELVLLVDRPGAVETSADELGAAIRVLLRDGSTRQAADVAADRFGISRREAYQFALRVAQEDDEDADQG